jgi:addiction module HigA family antidote
MSNSSKSKTPTETNCVKTKQDAIPRDSLKIPKPLSNPAAALIRDTLIHHGITQTEAAAAMKVSKAQLSDVIRQKKGISANLALRAQFCLGIPGDLLIRLQAQFDFQKAFHAQNGELQLEVRAIA